MADIPDPNGNPCGHRHPAMILRATDSATDVWLIGISTSFGHPLPGHWIEIPYQDGGHPITGLREPSVLKCNWVVRLHLNAVSRVIGKMPTDILERAVDRVLADIQRKKSGEHR